MKRDDNINLYKTYEEIELFQEDGYNIILPKWTFFKANFDGDRWNILFNGIKYWQYNYSIEDKIQEVTNK